MRWSVLPWSALQALIKPHCHREVTAFLVSGKKSAVVPFSPGTEARKQCREYGLSSEPLSLRLIRVQLKGGETEVLATSLLDEEAFPRAWFKASIPTTNGADSR